MKGMTISVRILRCILMLLLFHEMSSSMDPSGRGDAFCQWNTAATDAKAGPFPLPHRDKDVPWVWDAVFHVQNGRHRVQMTVIPWTACQFSVPEWQRFVNLIRHNAVYLKQVGTALLAPSE